jgi:hypothetical protein
MIAQKDYADTVYDLIDKSEILGREDRVSLSVEEAKKEIMLLNDIFLRASDLIIDKSRHKKGRHYKHDKSKRFWCEFLTLLYSTRNYCHRKKKRLSKRKKRNLSTLKFY